jgi:hypothetical protein
MLFQPVSAAEMHAARIITGATMVGMLGAPIFGRRARQARITFAILYIAAVLGFIVYHLIG